MSQYTAIDSNNCFNYTHSFNNVWNNCTVADDRPQLLTWLSPLEPSLRHCEIRDRRINDIGEWLMKSEKFSRWCGFSGEGEGDKAVLFCYGGPGAGKTFMRYQGLFSRVGRERARANKLRWQFAGSG